MYIKNTLDMLSCKWMNFMFTFNPRKVVYKSSFSRLLGVLDSTISPLLSIDTKGKNILSRNLLKFTKQDIGFPIGHTVIHGKT